MFYEYVKSLNHVRNQFKREKHGDGDPAMTAGASASKSVLFEWT